MEASSIDALVGKLRVMFPILLTEIGTPGHAAEMNRGIPFEVVLHTNTQASRPVA